MRIASRIALSLVLGAFSLAPLAARADITGDTFNFSYYYPFANSLFSDEGNFVADGSQKVFLYYFTYSAIGDKITFTMLPGLDLVLHGPLEGDPFDGAFITDLSQDLAGYTVALDPASTAIPDINLNPELHGATLTENLGDLHVVGGQTLIFDPIAPASPISPPAVPEPSSFVLLGTGVLSAAGAVRRRLSA